MAVKLLPNKSFDADTHVERATLSTKLKWVSLLLYATALIVPAYTTEHHGRAQTHFGIEAVLVGWLGVAAGHFSWFANVFLVFAWCLRVRIGINLPFVSAVLALAVALTFLSSTGIGKPGVGSVKFHPTAGYFLWLASIVAAACAAVAVRPKPRKPEGRAGAS